jgi:DUF2971 family protein
MGVLKEYLDSQAWDIDYSSIIDPDVDKIESTVYSKPLVYKYYSGSRYGFFACPQVRFTQRSALNDPFEMRQRWESVNTAGLRKITTERLRQLVPMILNNRHLLVQLLQEELNTRGVTLTPEQMDSILQTPQGKQILDAAQTAVEPRMIAMAECVFEKVEQKFQERLDSLVSQWGVFSVTELPLNHQMWAHYADEGAGFVIGFDSQHSFFLSKVVLGKNLLRKVLYSDERVQKFWNNPYYLFLVKNADWSYEREWRMFKELSECDEHRIVKGGSVYLSHLPYAAIKEVYFGYQCEASQIEQSKASLIRLDSEAPFFKVEVVHESGQLVPKSV